MASGILINLMWFYKFLKVANILEWEKESIHSDLREIDSKKIRDSK